MYLVRQVLDKEIEDRYGFKAGKVDDIVLDLYPGELPVVRGIVTGPGGAVSRLSERLVAVTNWFRGKLLGPEAPCDPEVIDWDRVTVIDIVVHADIDREDAGLMDSEQTIWRRWISRLPFAER